MAKYLDAMARAQQQREARQQKVHDTLEPVKPSVGDLASELEKVGDKHRLREAAGVNSPVLDRVSLPDIKLPTGLHPGVDETVISMHDNKSPVTEQVRHIRTNLEVVLSEHTSRPIVITSPVSGDGKTLFSANLATVLSDNSEHQAVLVDADMRKPNQHQLYGLSVSPGLADYLKGESTLDDVLCETSLPNLSVMTAGHPPSHPTTLLQSERMNELLQSLQNRYTWILFDTPPLLPVTDAAILARECVGLILVVRMGQTHAATIERAQNLLAESRLPVLGCVLNDYMNQNRQDEYYYKYYGSKEQKSGFIP